MPGKVLVTNAAAIDAKYGDRAGEVWQAVDHLVAADAERGTATTLVKLDDSSGPVGDAAVTDAADEAAAKGSVDQVVESLAPDYLVLLGAPDVVPHQTLDNPLHDEDPTLPSDLPYACDAPYSRDVAAFRAPTRVVSRLPDVTQATTPDVFLEMLDHAANWTSLPASEYTRYLGISAEVWHGSTALSLTNLFGGATELQLSPTAGPDWAKDLLERRMHFVNCHGAPFTPLYIGQGAGGTPVAHDAALVDQHVSKGTVLSAECCYGTELYPPQDGRLGMAYTYLRSGAYGLFGSTTVAYGPEDGNDSADLICQFFIRSILSGASTGRAGLEARQAFASAVAPLDPSALKTLGQFFVLGDASIHPVEAAAAPGLAAKSVSRVSDRRARLETRGRAIKSTVRYADTSSRHETSPDEVPGFISAFESDVPGKLVSFTEYSVRGGIQPKGIGDAGRETMYLAMHV